MECSLTQAPILEKQPWRVESSLMGARALEFLSIKTIKIILVTSRTDSGNQIEGARSTRSGRNAGAFAPLRSENTYPRTQCQPALTPHHLDTRFFLLKSFDAWTSTCHPSRPGSSLTATQLFHPLSPPRRAHPHVTPVLSAVNLLFLSPTFPCACFPVTVVGKYPPRLP